MKPIDTDDLKLMMENSDGMLTIVNTLTPAQFEKTHIPGSQNIPLESEDFVERVEAAAGSRNQPVIVYCASSACHSSEKAARELDEAQFSAVFDYEGGAEEWRKAGNPLV